MVWSSLEQVQSITLNLNENKNYLPLSYYENTVSVDNLLKYINDMNSKHKLNIKTEDFVAKVSNHNSGHQLCYQ